MDEAPARTRRRTPWFLAAAVLVVFGIAAYFMDADPAELFGNPLASAALVALGLVIGAVGARRGGPPATVAGEDEQA